MVKGVDLLVSFVDDWQACKPCTALSDSTVEVYCSTTGKDASHAMPLQIATVDVYSRATSDMKLIKTPERSLIRGLPDQIEWQTNSRRSEFLHLAPDRRPS